MHIMGLDLSLLNIGVVILNSKMKCIYKKHIINPPIEGRYGEEKRGIKIFQKLFRIRKKYNVGHVFMEGYSFGSKGKKLAQIHEVGGLVKSSMYLDKCDFYLITPGRLKQFLTGKGNAKKDLIIKEVFKKWKFDTDIEHIADGYVLARMGQCYFAIKKCTRKYEIELIKKLRKENSNEDENK